MSKGRGPDAPSQAPSGVRARTRRNRVLLGLVIVGLAAAASFLSVSTGSGGQGSVHEPTPREALLAYLGQAELLARDGGSVVELGIKPGMSDVLAGRLDDELLVDSAQGWQRRIGQVRNAWRELVPPESLVTADGLFVDALDAYVGVAVVLEEAALVPVEERQPFGDLAAAEGERADALWDQAAALVQAELRRFGLPAATWLPDETPSGP